MNATKKRSELKGMAHIHEVLKEVNKVKAFEDDCHEKMLHTLGFFITGNCPLRCEHCYTASSQDIDLKIDWGVISTWFDDIASTGDIQQVSITGGEPFCMFDRLRKVVRIITASGLRTSVITSAYWASDKKKIDKKILPLVEAGLVMLSISVGEYHQRQIPIHNVRLAITQARSHGLMTGVQYHYHGYKSVGQIIESLTILLGADVLSQVDNINFGAILAIGRARENFTPDLFPVQESNTFCSSVVPFLFPNGDVYACCGERSYGENHMRLGSLREAQFKTLLQRMRFSSMIPFVVFVGFEKTLQLLSMKGIEVLGIADIPKHEICRRCKMIISNPQVIRCMENQLRQELDEMIDLKQLLRYGYKFYKRETI